MDADSLPLLSQSCDFSTPGGEDWITGWFGRGEERWVGKRKKLEKSKFVDKYRGGEVKSKQGRWLLYFKI